MTELLLVFCHVYISDVCTSNLFASWLFVGLFYFFIILLLLYRVCESVMKVQTFILFISAGFIILIGWNARMLWKNMSFNYNLQPRTEYERVCEWTWSTKNDCFESFYTILGPTKQQNVAFLLSTTQSPAWGGKQKEKAWPSKAATTSWCQSLQTGRLQFEF